VSADPFRSPLLAPRVDPPLFIVLLAGLVAMTLNLILPQEEEPVEEHYDVEHVLDNAETGSIHKRERSDA